MTSLRGLPTAALVGIAAFLFFVPSTSAFVLPFSGVPLSMLPSLDRCHRPCGASALEMAEGDTFDVMVDLPGEGLSAKMKFPSVLDAPSEVVEVRYKLPFGLDVAPKDQMCVCTKDGAGGEKVGDILRYTSQWTLGLPRGDGVVTTAMSFSGGISWQISMFDVMRAGRWEDVVEALTSNAPDRTDEVVLLFERPLPEATE